MILITNKEGLKKDEGDNFTVLLTFDNNKNLINFNIKSEDSYLPKIFPVFDEEDYEVIDFKIETKGSGTFYKDEIKKIITGYEKAVSIIDELKEIIELK